MSLYPLLALLVFKQSNSNSVQGPVIFFNVVRMLKKKAERKKKEEEEAEIDLKIQKNVRWAPEQAATNPNCSPTGDGGWRGNLLYWPCKEMVSLFYFYFK